MKVFVQMPDKLVDGAVRAAKYQQRPCSVAGPALDLKGTAPNLWHFHRWTPEGRLRIPGMLLGCSRHNLCPLDEGSCVEVGHPQSAGAEVAPAARDVPAGMPLLLHFSRSSGNQEVKMPAEPSQGCCSPSCKAGVVRETRCSVV